MVIAEKTVTAVERGEANTRWRDSADVLAISSVHETSASELAAALQAVAAYRGATLRPLLPALAAMTETAQAKWASWRRRQAAWTRRGRSAVHVEHGPTCGCIYPEGRAAVRAADWCARGLLA